MEAQMQTNNFGLPTDFEASENETTWLMDADGERQIIWVALPLPNHYLEIEINPSDYPGLTIATVQKTAEELRQHILENCGDMLVRHSNLRGCEQLDDAMPAGSTVDDLFGPAKE